MADLVDSTLFLARTYKVAIGRPDLVWVNNYEFQSATAGVSDNDMRDVLDILVQAERKLEYAVVKHTRATFSTWAPDSNPYNPFEFLVADYNQLGTRDAAGGAPLLDHNICLWFKKTPQFGRSGKVFYRGCLAEDDVTGNTALGWDLTPSSGLLTAISQYESGMADVLNSSAASALVLTLIGTYGVSGEGVARPVTALQVGGVTINRANHRYYNRGQSTGGQQP